MVGEGAEVLGVDEEFLLQDQALLDGTADRGRIARVFGTRRLHTGGERP